MTGKYPISYSRTTKSTGTVRIDTERLALRRFMETDADDLYENYGSDDNVRRFISFFPCSTREGAREFIDMHIQRYQATRDFYGWAITLDGVVIGSIGLFDIDHESDSCEIGYSLGSRWWGLGYATEAVSAVLDFAFNTLGAHRIQATYHPDNIASKRVLEKVNMRYEGVMRDGQKNPDGSFSDQIVCARLSTDNLDG